MRKLILGVVALAASGCGGDPAYLTPTRICVEKANLRMVPSRGGAYEAFDCQRYVLACTEPLVMVQAADRIVCRLRETPAVTE